MKKEDILRIFGRIANSSYIKIEFDMGALEGKLFKDKKFGNLLIYGGESDSIDINFSNLGDDIPSVELIAIWDEKIKQWHQLI